MVKGTVIIDVHRRPISIVDSDVMMDIMVVNWLIVSRQIFEKYFGGICVTVSGIFTRKFYWNGCHRSQVKIVLGNDAIIWPIVLVDYMGIPKRGKPVVFRTSEGKVLSSW